MEQYTLQNFFSPEECADLIRRAEESGGLDEEIELYNGTQARQDFDDADLAGRIDQRLRSRQIEAPIFHSVRRRFNLSKYTYPRGTIGPHEDGHSTQGNLQSQWTALLYLTAADGSDTVFTDGPEGPEIARFTPTPGLLAIFPQDVTHHTTPLNAGTKYVLRTDLQPGAH